MNEKLRIVVGTAIFTAVEVVTLTLWLRLIRRMLQRVAGIVLFIGLVIEHIIQHNVAKGRRLIDLSNLPFKGILGFSAIEAFAIWIPWLAISARYGHGIGFIYLVLTLIAKHAIANNVIAGRPFFAFRYGADRYTVVASVLEAIGGQGWLINVEQGRVVQGIVVLAGFSFAEHLVLIVGARKQLSSTA